MNRSGIGRVQQAARTTPGTTRVSGATKPMASRAQFRGGTDLLNRGTAAPTARRSSDKDKDEDKDKPLDDDDLNDQTDDKDDDDKDKDDDDRLVTREDDEDDKDEKDKKDEKESLFSK